jgi:hypothetical protein
VKYLGVTFSNDLKWNAHIENIIGKANKTLNFVIRTLKRANRKVKETAYTSLVRPILEYGECLWDPHQLGVKWDLEKVQRRAARFVLSRYEKCSSVTQMQKELGWESLEARRRKKRLSMFYKAYVGEPAFKEIRDRINEADYIGRNDHTFKVRSIKQKTDKRKYSFLNRTIEEWNGLPAEIFEPFPRNVKAFLKKVGELNKLDE